MSSHPIRVAIVNDDVAFVRLLDSLLRDEEHVSTLLLHVGEIAHESIKQQQPDLVVLDIGTDVTSVSWHMVDLLMLDPATTNIPVIVCSAANDFLSERRAKLEIAGYRIIEKPFHLDELLSHVRSYLPTTGDRRNAWSPVVGEMDRHEEASRRDRGRGGRSDDQPSAARAAG